VEKKNKKKSLGQYFTKSNFWLKDSVLDFIKSRNFQYVIDPFAGDGDLLKVSESLGFKNLIGYDIDSSLGWKINDSLIDIPKIENSLIITNPPYLTNYSAKRKGIYKSVSKYFSSSSFDDLYQLAIKKCMDSCEYGVMIVPETFINSSFNKSRLVSITVVEDMIFNDTDNPICVICFDSNFKNLDEVNVFKNNEFVSSLGNLEKLRKKPKNNFKISFNHPEGNIALRAVDTTKDSNLIKFMFPSELDYDFSKIKNSSRLITLIKIDLDTKTLKKVIDGSNSILNDYRHDISDLLLSPFKGNRKSGTRRRRLDYQTARSILEEAIEFSLYDKLL
jgi:hypothetical protein